MASSTDSVTIDLIVDSGADITLVDPQVAQELGLRSPTPEELYAVEGVGGGTPVYYRQIQRLLASTLFPVELEISYTATLLVLRDKLIFLTNLL
ncbi:retropepsin-like domain-containing protein [Chroococcidiopsis sp. FACHB-1243]|uniref:aspartyl protease family protein n=1 Tax=Chroococcidiopsis sp. [FACHB-1243] TaxID=2692781 RepID=UPI0017843DB0|nr:aspartyl protease family protein [Chroococcidiopsis sp. [FACHB-1243]]MBD2305437.1 retropepsin-like domain-containing protein [Chroococcidiopsis sp. [FACHB-1243]]